MLLDFFFALRKGGLKVSLSEYLALLEALDKRLAVLSLDDFYFLARGLMVKDESLFDRFDRIFGAYFSGVEELFGGKDGEGGTAAIPEEWLRKQAELFLSEEEKKKIEDLGGWEELMK